MALFGETIADLKKYITPVDDDSLSDYGFDSTALTALLDEKADLVFSYLPPKYRVFWQARVHKLELVKCAFEGQASAPKPIGCGSDIVGYINPPNELRDFTDSEVVSVTASGANLVFSALEKFDVLVIDYTPSMSGVSIPALAWAAKVLAAGDLMAIISGDFKTGEIPPRLEHDFNKIMPWLKALNNPENNQDRIIVRQLEYNFWQGKIDFSTDLDLLQRRNSEGLS